MKAIVRRALSSFVLAVALAPAPTSADVKCLPGTRAVREMGAGANDVHRCEPVTQRSRATIAPAITAKRLKAEPAAGQLRQGQRVLVDDGSCPAGQIKEVIGGGNINSATGASRAGGSRQRRCIAAGGASPASATKTEARKKPEHDRQQSQTKPETVQNRQTAKGQQVLVPLREPNPDEKWIVFEEDGTIREIEGIEHLYIYYALKRIPWPYKELTSPKQPWSSVRHAIDQAAPRIQPSEGARHGYGIDHTRKLSAWAQARNQLLIFRARNVASLRYDDDPDFTTKPEQVSLDKDGLWVSDERRSIGVGRPMSDMHTMPAGFDGTFRDKRGRDIPIAGVVADKDSPIKIDGKYVIGDFDPQIIVEKKGADKIYDNVLTDPRDEAGYIKALNEWLNAGVEPARQKPWVRHGPEATYKGLPDQDDMAP